MANFVLIIHYINIAVISFLSALANGIGGGLASKTALEAINIQPRAKGEIIKTCIIGLALIETAAIMALIIIVLMLTKTAAISNIYQVTAECGITCAIAIPALIVGIVSAFPIQQSCLSIARQPFFSQQIVNLMLITQIVIQSGVIFGFLIALLINLQMLNATAMHTALILVSAGIALGIGAIGPIIGIATFAKSACQSISVNRKAYPQLLSFVFISEAIIETPLILSFLIAMIIVFINPANQTNFSVAIKAMSAALCIGIATTSPGIASGKTAASACQQLVKNVQYYSMISQASLFSQGLIDASAIYALLISLLILFIK